MAAAVIGAGVLLAVIVFVIYCKSKGERLPLQVTVPADLASRRWDLRGEDTASPGAWAPRGTAAAGAEDAARGLLLLPLLTGAPCRFSPRLEDLPFACSRGYEHR